MVMQIRRTAIPDNPPDGLLPGQLAVEMASDPAKLWVGVPTDIDPATRRLFAEVGPASMFRTGDVKLTLRSYAEAGWVMMDDGTIGRVLSGANHVGDQFENLFKLLFDSLSDANAPLTSSDGINVPRIGLGSAQEAWDNFFRITLCRVLGRALAVGGSGAGLTHQTVGGFVGAEVLALSTSQMPAHIHGPLYASFISWNDGSNPAWWLSGTPSSIWSYWHNTQAAGGGGAHSSMQPTAFLNVLMCL